MSKRRMGGGGSRGRRIGPMLASGRGGRTGPSPSDMQAPLSPRRTPVVPETRRRPPRGMTKGGPIMKKKGYAKGGLQNGMMMKKKGYAKGGKVRGCGIATKGVRKAKMVTMKGS